MNFELIIKEEAHLDIQEAYHWYNEKQAGLGKHFLDELELYFNIFSLSCFGKFTITKLQGYGKNKQPS